MKHNKQKNITTRTFYSRLRDIGITSFILIYVTGISFVFHHLGFTEANIITVYILGVLVTSVITTNKIYGLLSSVIGVFLFNFFFTVPKFTFRAYDKGYPVTFLVMFIASLITGSLATKLKNHAKRSGQDAFRMKVLFETSQLLQKAEGKKEIAEAAANQSMKLLGRSIVIYLLEEGKLSEPLVFSYKNIAKEDIVSEEERKVAEWVLENNYRAGATTEIFSEAKCLYFAIRANERVYGILGIVIEEDSLESFERGVLLSILSECALALENEKNAREKEEAALLAKNEQLRANLLRAISHDLRTPLTSISGNASNLISNEQGFDHETRKQIYIDIYEESMWLINLVENLLSVTRIQEGKMEFRMSSELLDEVISEALRHINDKNHSHKIQVDHSEEFLLVKIDARLIMQVIINLVDNALKYTPEGTEIIIKSRKDQERVIVEISDNGPGISKEMQPHIFEMFYSGKNKIADSRRSLGLGLALCKSIINAHGGEISFSENVPHGSVFTFTLPVEEVELHE